MATEAVAPKLTRPGDVGLRREMGLLGATWASVTSLIGSGWLFGSWKGAFSTGTSALLAWGIAGVCVIILALVHAELGGLYPISGGTARFPHFSFGGVVGISFGFFSWLQAVTVAPIEAFAVMQYLAFYWHGLFNTTTGEVTATGFGMSVLLMAICTALNFYAMRVFNKINSGITIWKIAIPVVCIILLFTHFKTTNFNAHGGFTPFGWKAMFAAIPGAGVVFAYLGFEQADQLAGEIKNPQRNLPRAIIYSILIATVIYILLQVVFIGALNPSALTHGWAALHTNPGLELGPLAFIAGGVGLSWFAIILRLDAFISPAGTALMYETSTSRVGYGLARNRYFPPPFGWVAKNGVPWFSLIFAFVAGIFFLLPFPSWSALVGLVTSASVLMYAGAPLSMSALRKQVPDAPRPYRVPGAAVIGPLSFVIASVIIYFSGFDTVYKLGIILVIGYVLIGGWMVFDKQRPPLNWKSAQWLPVYLIGMGIISWQGKYCSAGPVGPGVACHATNRLGFGIDILIVAVFALIIFYWAQAVRSPRDHVLELVARQAGEPEPENA